MDLAERIAAWRKSKGLTQRELAEAVGVTPAAVYQWEDAGENHTTPSQENLFLVVEALGLTMAGFWGRLPEAKAS